MVLTIEQVFCKVRTGQWTFSEFEEWLESDREKAFNDGSLYIEHLCDAKDFDDYGRQM